MITVNNQGLNSLDKSQKILWPLSNFALHKRAHAFRIPMHAINSRHATTLHDVGGGEINFQCNRVRNASVQPIRFLPRSTTWSRDNLRGIWGISMNLAIFRYGRDWKFHLNRKWCNDISLWISHGKYDWSVWSAWLQLLTRLESIKKATQFLPNNFNCNFLPPKLFWWSIIFEKHSGSYYTLKR